MAEEAMSICSVCKRSADEGKKLLQCVRCKGPLYCGKDCQSTDWGTHKSTCKRQNYLLKFHLNPDHIIDPPIYCTLSCPAEATFADLHEALQIAFGWASTHTYDFKIKDPVAEAAHAAQEPDTREDTMLRVLQSISTTGGLEPGVPNLLRIVEEYPHGPGENIMGGKGIDFIHNGSRYHALTKEKKASAVKLRDVFEKPAYKDKPMEYEYDFGDCWEHAIALEGCEEGTAFFVCVDGEGRGVAEDVGSWRGWNKLKEAYRAPRPEGRQKEKMRWFERMASNCDPQGLRNGRERVWSRELINKELADLAENA